MFARPMPMVLLLVAACAPKETAAPPAVPQEASFTATNFAFTGPDSIAPGVTSFRLVNHGDQPHHMILGRLDDGKSLADIMAFMQANPNAEPPMVWYGSAGMILPGDSTGSTVDLPAGHYVAMCFIADPADQQMHFMKGMVKEFVVAGPRHEAALPTADVEIRASDFAFAMPEMTAGTHTIHFVNDGPQTHEIGLVRLNEGVTPEQFLAALAPGAAAGPPPGVALGGPGALSVGKDNYWSVTLTPGTYLVVCFVPDVKDGVPHAMKGMTKTFTIP